MQDEYGMESNMMDSSLRNRLRVRQIFQNFGFLSLGKMLGDICTFFLFVVLSRAFGQEGIGQYSFAMALTGFFVVFSDFGLYSFSIKEISRYIGPIGDYYDRILSLRLILSAIVFGVLLMVIPFLPFSWETKLVIAVIGAYQVIDRMFNGFAAVFIAREDTHLAGLLQVSTKAVASLAGIMIVMAGGTLVMAIATLPMAATGQIVVAYGLATKKYRRPRLFVSWSSLAHTIREAIPYALSIFLFQLYSRADVVALGFFLGAASAGVYNVAYRVVFLLMFIPHLAGVSLFPLASRLYVNSKKELEVLYHKFFNMFILIGLPAAFGLWLIAPDLIGVIFGETFAESASVLRLLAGLLFLGGVNRILGVFLMSCDRQVERAKSQWVVAWVNVLGNIVLIPAFGVKGAAVARLTSEALLVFLLIVRLRVILGWPQVGSRLALSSVAVASFCVPFAFLPPLPSGVVIPVSVLLYSGTLALFKDIRRNEMRSLMNLVRGKA